MYFTLPVDVVPQSVIDLFDGQCVFEPSHASYHTHYYDFEDGYSEWSEWDGQMPQVVLDESYCGRHSLYVRMNTSIRACNGQGKLWQEIYF